MLTINMVLSYWLCYIKRESSVDITMESPFTWNNARRVFLAQIMDLYVPVLYRNVFVVFYLDIETNEHLNVIVLLDSKQQRSVELYFHWVSR